METYFLGFALGDAILTSDFMGKFIIIFLVGLSCFAFMKIFVRYSVYKATEVEHDKFEALIKKYKHPAGMIFERMQTGICNIEIYRAIVMELIPKLEKKGITKEQLRTWNGETSLPSLTEQEIARIKVIAENELSKQLAHLEADINLIGTISIISPSIGLFGTVWGVLVSFMSMADGSGAAIITNVAPGIGGALATTVVGLIVSIPTTVVYNHLCTKLKTFTIQAETFVDKIITDICLYHSPSEKPVQNIQFSGAPQQQNFASFEDSEVGGKYNA